MTETYVEQQSDSEVVTGVVTGIIDKGGDKWQVAVKTDPSSQYSKNLWTKDGDLVHQLRQLFGTAMSFQCGVSHWTNAQGAPVRSLWINGVGPAQHSVAAPPQQQPQQAQPQTQGLASLAGMQGQAQPQPMAPQAQPQPQSQMPQGYPVTQYDDDPKQGKIHRQTASKVAAILLGYLPPEERTLDTILTVSEKLVAYYDDGIAPVTSADNGQGDEFPPGF